MVGRSWLLLAVGLAGCAEDDDVGLDGDTSTPEPQDCDGADPFTAGVSVTTDASGTTIAITTADPTPPDVGDNRWTISVTDGAGPVEGLAPVLTPWMPMHAHGLTPPDYAATDGGGGVYEVETFDLIMPGLWEFTFDLDATGTAPDLAVFRFCAEG